MRSTTLFLAHLAPLGALALPASSSSSNLICSSGTPPPSLPPAKEGCPAGPFSGYSIKCDNAISGVQIGAVRNICAEECKWACNAESSCVGVMVTNDGRCALASSVSGSFSVSGYYYISKTKTDSYATPSKVAYASQASSAAAYSAPAQVSSQAASPSPVAVSSAAVSSSPAPVVSAAASSSSALVPSSAVISSVALSSSQGASSSPAPVSSSVVVSSLVASSPSVQKPSPVVSSSAVISSSVVPSSSMPARSSLAASSSVAARSSAASTPVLAASSSAVLVSSVARSSSVPVSSSAASSPRSSSPSSAPVSSSVVPSRTPVATPSPSASPSPSPSPAAPTCPNFTGTFQSACAATTDDKCKNGYTIKCNTAVTGAIAFRYAFSTLDACVGACDALATCLGVTYSNSFSCIGYRSVINLMPGNGNGLVSVVKTGSLPKA